MNLPHEVCLSRLSPGIHAEKGRTNSSEVDKRIVFGMCMNSGATDRQTRRWAAGLISGIPDEEILDVYSETGNYVEGLLAITFSTEMAMEIMYKIASYS